MDALRGRWPPSPPPFPSPPPLPSGRAAPLPPRGRSAPRPRSSAAFNGARCPRPVPSRPAGAVPVPGHGSPAAAAAAGARAGRRRQVPVPAGPAAQPAPRPAARVSAGPAGIGRQGGEGETSFKAFFSPTFTRVPPGCARCGPARPAGSLCEPGPWGALSVNAASLSLSSLPFDNFSAFSSGNLVLQMSVQTLQCVFILAK